MKDLTRRTFLSAAATAGLAATAGAMAGCSTASKETDGLTSASGGETDGGLNHQSHDEKWAFEIAPEPISDDLIVETLEADIIVVGAGIAGTTTAVSAAESGATVILVSASSRPIGRGGTCFAFNSDVQKEHGIQYSDDQIRKIIKTQLMSNSYFVDMKKWADIISYSTESMNWAIEKYQSQGLKVSLEPPYIDPDSDVMTIGPLGHNFYNDEFPLGMKDGAPLQAKSMASILTNDLGGEAYYSMPVRQLIRGGAPNGTSGAVEGCIAEDTEGKYHRFMAKKAVVLATGDFTRDKDLMAKYTPWVYEQYRDYMDWDTVDYDVEANWSGLYHGDGHKMALWVGAAWQRTFPCPAAGCDGLGGPAVWGGNFSGLGINVKGKRFLNEVATGFIAGVAIQQQPKRTAFSVWDDSYADRRSEWEVFGCTVDRVNDILPLAPEDYRKSWEGNREKGTYFKADTLEELVAIMAENGLEDTSQALKTIDEYNEYCRAGNDKEFHKNPGELAEIAQGPFWAARSEAVKIRTVFGGPRSSSDMQALDENDEPIQGLYTTGCMAGDMFANSYNFYTPGISLGGIGTTLSYLLGRRLALL